eukprot:7951007-Pyramimonas_sp.AAC.1
MRAAHLDEFDASGLGATPWEGALARVRARSKKARRAPVLVGARGGDPFAPDASPPARGSLVRRLREG